MEAVLIRDIYGDGIVLCEAGTHFIYYDSSDHQSVNGHLLYLEDDDFEIIDS